MTRKEVVVSARVSPETKRQIAERAAIMAATESWVINQALKQYFREPDNASPKAELPQDGKEEFRAGLETFRASRLRPEDFDPRRKHLSEFVTDSMRLKDPSNGKAELPPHLREDK